MTGGPRLRVLRRAARPRGDTPIETSFRRERRQFPASLNAIRHGVSYEQPQLSCGRLLGRFDVDRRAVGKDLGDTLHHSVAS